MKDGDTGELLWQEDDKWKEDLWKNELPVHLPKSILKRRVVAREITFSSDNQVSTLRLVQNILLNGYLIEEWKFTFGFVIAGSTNSWQQIIQSSSQMIEAETLSGNITIETSFYDGDAFITQTTMRIFYD